MREEGLIGFLNERLFKGTAAAMVCDRFNKISLYGTRRTGLCREITICRQMKFFLDKKSLPKILFYYR